MDQVPADLSHRESRRSALVRLLLGWTTLFVLPALYVIGRYLVPPQKKIGEVSSIIAAKVGDIPMNTAKIVKMGPKPVIVVHTLAGEFKAFSATCTHLGCTVEYRGDRGGYFHCNCHGGEYDLTGRNISGPPPKPLTPYHLSLRSDDIVVSKT